jgi:hypothetical protein
MRNEITMAKKALYRSMINTFRNPCYSSGVNRIKSVTCTSVVIVPGHTLPGKRGYSVIFATQLGARRELHRIFQQLQLRTGSMRERNGRQVEKVGK